MSHLLTHRSQLRLVETPPAQSHPELGALSRGRGGTYSPTTDTIVFADGSTARTDLIRLNPGLDTYSLDIDGISPRQLCHYRAGGWAHQVRECRREIAAILLNSFPHVPLATLRRQLVSLGHDAAAGLKEHEAIAGTQAAIWQLANGLRLDTRPLAAPVDRWSVILDPGASAHLDLDVADAPVLRSYGLTIGPRTGRHELIVALEQSRDGDLWRPVSASTLRLPGDAPRGRHIAKAIGHGATVSRSVGGVEHGHSRYRLAITGPVDRTGHVQLLDVAAQISGASRYRNSEGVVLVHQYLLGLAESAWRRADDSHRVQALVGSRVPGGTAEFTTLAAVMPGAAATVRQVTQARAV